MEQLQVQKPTIGSDVVDWLLEESEPSAQYYTLHDLLGKEETDPSVANAKSNIGKVGWAGKILAKQKENAYWDNPISCYVPKFSACGWQLVVLADIGVSSQHPRIRNAVDHYLERHNVESGGFSLRPKGQEKFEPHVCLTGNMVRALARMGYASDDRVRKGLDWLLSMQLPDGGWNCFAPGRHGSFMATVEPLWALAEMITHDPRGGWKESAAKGSEFLLKHRVYKSDVDESVVLFDFLKIHYPMHYGYDFLHGLRVLMELGVKDDSRLDDAVQLLLMKRLKEGSWKLDGVYRGWRHAHPIHRGELVSRPEERDLITEGWGGERTLQIEEAGKPSKWITLQSLLVLKRLDRLGF